MWARMSVINLTYSTQENKPPVRGEGYFLLRHVFRQRSEERGGLETGETKVFFDVIPLPFLSTNRTTCDGRLLTIYFLFLEHLFLMHPHTVQTRDWEPIRLSFEASG